MNIADDYADVARRLRALSRDDSDFIIRCGGAVIWLKPTTSDAVDYFALFTFSGCKDDWVPFNVSDGFEGAMRHLATMRPQPRSFTVTSE